MQEVLITASKEELLIVSSPWNLNRKQGILLEYKTTRANHQTVVLIFFSLDVRSRIPCFCLLPPWILLLLVCKIAVWISTCQLVSMFFSNANFNHLRCSRESKIGLWVSKSDWKRHRCQLLIRRVWHGKSKENACRHWVLYVMKSHEDRKSDLPSLCATILCYMSLRERSNKDNCD